jgi:predicted GNAT family acetyltransferase
MTILVPADLDRVKALHDSVLAEPRTAALYVMRDCRFFARHLGWHGRVLGFFDNAGELVAYSVLGLPDADAADNLGASIELPRTRRAQVAHLDGTAISADWRGHGLQRRFTAERIKIARRQARPILLATCQPDNHWSLANLFRMGLVVVALRTKYQKPRLILRRNLDAQHACRADRCGPRVAVTDLTGHRQALADGWIGTMLAHDTAGQIRVVYDSVQAGGVQ